MDTTHPTPVIHAPISHGPPPQIIRLYTAHAILACLAWAFIFPLGGILIRLLSFRRLLWVHACLQLFGFLLYTAAVGLGIRLSINPKHWRMGNKHVIIGLIIFVLFFIQGITGYVHHLLYKKKGGRSEVSYVHLWTGRVCLTLGIVNAGFGFQITGKGWGTWEVVTYTVCAVVVWVGYVLSVVVGEMKRRKRVTGTGAGVESGEGSRSNSESEGKQG